MQPFSQRRSRRSLPVRAAVLLAAGCLLGACDRHRADDLPESYGHGSSHQKEYDRHEPDSRGDRHFSDSKGVNPDAPEGKGAPQSTATPGAPEPGRMFPSPAK